jgi:hypothetical protein
MRAGRSLEELARDAAVGVAREPEFASLEPSGTDRRRMLKLMAASLALGGLAGCDVEEAEEIVPHVRDPSPTPAGQAVHYASAHCHDGIANGMLVRTVDGRPIKIEGNPQHPVSRGGTDSFMQASVLDLYDPDRSQAVAQLGRPASLDRLEATLPSVPARCARSVAPACVF